MRRKINWGGGNLNNIDLLLGGSPCQGFSTAGKKLNFNDPRSILFFEFVRLLNEVKPKYFLFENVKMKQERVDIISSYLWVQPIEINSSLVSWQNRKRLYRTNIPGVNIPEDKKILLKDVLEGNVDDKYYINDPKVINIVNWEMRVKQATKKGYIIAEYGDGINIRYPNSTTRRGRVIKGKSQTLTTQNEANVVVNNRIRELTPIECERLQTLPDNYTEGVSKNQRYKMLGNGRTVDVIKHILSFIPNK